ncbi:MAG: amidohydrolase family protein [Planctomycetota bacterium]
MTRPLREAHAHLPAYGRSLGFCDLAHANSADDALVALRRFAEGTTPDGWVIGLGARPEAWPRSIERPDGWFNAGELAVAVGGRPAAVWCFDHHALCASTAALELTGISRDTPDPAHGVIVRRGDGEPTGVLLEHAVQPVWDAVPEPTESERVEHLRSACERLASMGFIEAHDLKSPDWLGPALAELDRAGELPIRVGLYPLIPDLDAVAADRGSWETDRVKLLGGKIFTDGTLNSRTAWMLHPYADPIPEHPTGTPMVEHEDIDLAVRAAESHGLHIAAHAIGDGAVRAVLDSIGRTSTTNRAGHRIEHAELIDEADVPRFAAMGVVASVQPCHLLPDVEALKRLVPGRLDRVLPIRELLDSGATVWFGSDVPIVRPDPGDSILAAVSRRRDDMADSESVSPSQAISEDEAWAAFAPTTSAFT